MESLDEIDEIVKHTFDAKNLLSFEDFVNVVEIKKSDVFKFGPRLAVLTAPQKL